MSEIPSLGPEQVRRFLPMDEAIKAVESSFRTETETPSRVRVGDTLVMPGRVDHTTGVKLVSVIPGKPYGTVIILHPDGSLRGMVDGPTLTAIRTGAVSGLATRLLSDPTSSTLAMLGAGAMAYDQIEAVRAVRPIGRVLVWSRDPNRASALAERVGGEVCIDPDSAVSAADVVCTATPSQQPLFSPSAVSERCHINAIGAFTPEMVEIPAETVQSAWVLVEDRDAAGQEAGDLSQAGVSSVHTLRELLSGHTTVPAENRRTLFKSVGLASMDVAAGLACLISYENGG